MKTLSRLLIGCATLLLPTASASAQHLMDGASGFPHGIPDLCAAPTIASVSSGAWSSPATWSAGRVPVAGDRVRVGASTAVTYDVINQAVLECVGVEGELAFSPTTSTRLDVITLLVYPNGTLQIGTEARPLSGNLTAEIAFADRPIDTAADPEQFGHGLLVLGNIRVHGAAKAPTFLRTAAEPLQGQGNIRLAASPSGWAASDALLIPDTRVLPHTFDVPLQIEQPRAAVVQGTDITLTAALQYDHPAARDGDDTIQFQPYVANLTRNVILRSANPQGVRGHVIFAGNADVDVRYATFQDLGRTTIQPLNNTTFDASGHAGTIGTNQVGRYAIHLHHLRGPAPALSRPYQYVLVGNAVIRSSKWALAIHNSHYGLVQNNVFFDVHGAGLMTEDGNESFNRIEANLVVQSTGTRARADERSFSPIPEFGYEGGGFWFHGPNNYVRDNVAVNIDHYGFNVITLGTGSVRVPKFAGADLTKDGEYEVIDNKASALLDFTGNEAISSLRGLQIWDVGAVCCAEMREVAPSTIRNFKAWHISSYGFFHYAMNRVTIDGWRQYGMKSKMDTPAGIVFGDYPARNSIIRNADIQSVRIGILTGVKPGDVRDIYGNAAGTLSIENSYLRNAETNLFVESMFATTGGGIMLPPRQIVVKDVRFAQQSSSTVNINMVYSAAGVPNPNVIQKDVLLIFNFNGVSGDNFQVYRPQQAPSFVVPQSGSHDSYDRLVGAPEPGLSNTAAWNLYQIAIGGAVAPCSTVRPAINGFVCPTTAVYTPPPPSPPAAPYNLKIIRND